MVSTVATNDCPSALGGSPPLLGACANVVVTGCGRLLGLVLAGSGSGGRYVFSRVVPSSIVLRESRVGYDSTVTPDDTLDGMLDGSDNPPEAVPLVSVGIDGKLLASGEGGNKSKGLCSSGLMGYRLSVPVSGNTENKSNGLSDPGLEDGVGPKRLDKSMVAEFWKSGLESASGVGRR
jgi:hypothetical protein